MFKRLFKKLRPKAVLVKYPETMSLERVRQVFLDQGESSNIWQALDTVIDQQLLDSINQVSEAKQDHCERAHAAGQVDAISCLKARIEEFKQWNTQRNRNLK